MNVSAPLLQVSDLRKTYHLGESAIPVLQGASLELRSGERVAVMGKSGVGKSTLLHLLGALDRADGGSVTVDGVNLYGLPSAQLNVFRNRAIGFVFQFHHLQPDFTALENVMMPMLIARAPRAEARSRAGELLERVGLSPRRDHRPAELSGGEQQRVAIARALANRPRLVLADEPTGNLDETTSGAVQDLLLEVNAEAGSALLIATHSRPLAERLGDIRHLRGGKLVREGDE